MDKLTRGNLLATLKSLKKHKRPKAVVANVAVQAICGGSVPKPDKSADLKSVVERRKAAFSRSAGDYMNTLEFKKCEADFNEFLSSYKQRKYRKDGNGVVSNGCEKILDGSSSSNEIV